MAPATPRLLVFLLSVFAALLALRCSGASRPPNIVFIVADDLGYGDIGAFGQTKIRTPHLDRMAAEGMKFTQHYAGNAVCAPSRSVLMTGQHPGHTYIRDNRGMAKGAIVGKPEVEGQFPIPDETMTLAEVLKNAGYTTGGFGKWGLGGPGTSGEPLRQGFDRWFGYNGQAVAHNFYPTYLWDNDKTIELDNHAFSAHDTLRPDEDPLDPASYQRFQGHDYSADRISTEVLNFIRENQNKPFFVYWPTTVPHVALQVPDDSLDEYAGEWDDPPYPGGKGYIPHFKPRAAYAAMITRMDRDIGRAMELVAELGLDDNTLFVFTSDNGPTHGTHEGLAGTDAIFFNSAGGLRDGKGSLYEGGVRVPTIVRWPGQVTAGTSSDRVTGFEDWLPTLAVLAQTTAIPASIDGIDFSPTIRGVHQAPRPFLYREFSSYRGQQSIRVGNWKAIRQNLIPGKGETPIVKTELYDLSNDISESQDVAADHSDLVTYLEKLMAANRSPSVEFPFPALDEPPSANPTEPETT
jgi:arylsulfatase A